MQTLRTLNTQTQIQQIYFDALLVYCVLEGFEWLSIKALRYPIVNKEVI